MKENTSRERISDDEDDRQTRNETLENLSPVSKRLRLRGCQTLRVRLRVLLRCLVARRLREPELPADLDEEDGERDEEAEADPDVNELERKMK